MEKRYAAALNKIRHGNLLELPNEVKEILKGNYDLETKTKMLEEIAKVKEGAK